MLDAVVQQTRSLRGVTKVPGDKSISHRAVIIGALAEGETIIENFLAADDCLATVRCMRALGAQVEGPDNGRVLVRGSGLQGLREPEDVLDAGNSGTTMRLLLGMLAGQPFFSVLTGDTSLRRRPMRRVTDPLRQMGATILGRGDASFAPLAVRGRPGLRSLRYTSPVPSAQVKSAILLAGLYAEGYTSVTEPVRSRDHTERMLGEFGAEIQADGNTVTVKGRPRLKGKKITVPGDISSAAFLLAAALILPDADITITGVGLNPTRTGIIDVFKSMGGDIELFATQETGREPVGNIRVRSSRLVGTTIDGSIVPRLIDEIPVLAVVATLAEGVTVICGAEELRVKESNRLQALATELARFGADITEMPDGLIIRGRATLQGATVESYGDHRIAMALAVAGLAAQGTTTIRGAECVNISFPGFFEVLDLLRPQ